MLQNLGRCIPIKVSTVWSKTFINTWDGVRAADADGGGDDNVLWVVCVVECLSIAGDPMSHAVFPAFASFSIIVLRVAGNIFFWPPTCISIFLVFQFCQTWVDGLLELLGCFAEVAKMKAPLLGTSEARQSDFIAHPASDLELFSLNNNEIINNKISTS